VARTSPSPRQHGAVVLILVALVLTGIGIWLFQNAFFEASGKVASHLQDPQTVRYAVDPYIWSPAASRKLRRRYAAGHAIFSAAVLLWAWIIWTSGAALMAGILTVMAIGMAGMLAFRAIRHGL